MDSKNMYRITVRQLESLIRLAEGLARLHLDDEVKPEYVKEAARLLQRSIINVETTEIDLFAEAELMNDNQDGAGGAGGAAGGEAGERDEMDFDEDDQDKQDKGTGGSASGEGQRMPISFERYEQIAHAMILHLRSTPELEHNGMQQKELIEWFLEQEVDNERINSAEELKLQQRLVTAVVTRLVHTDHVLIQIEDYKEWQNSGEVEVDQERLESATRDEMSARVLTVHPNYVIPS
eukprot:TRINITY_DN1258_c0_g1_i1.p2 TRINITY_DN1258_c0_g1~~TRINITY_DN1258_c0_g1_i1.p2  ORF type:complete len:236 (-),score=112.96 TRINITY_DN1258_c0_g1_i1:374-1081(-)